MKIQITSEDIQKGNRNQCKTCPTALAINRKLKPIYCAFVKYHYTLISSYDEAKMLLIHNPLNLTRWLMDYDNDDVTIEPIEIDLGEDIDPFCI